MADTKTAAAGKSLNLDNINPLICADGDTLPVQTVLTVISRMLNDLSPDSTLDTSETLGMSFIVDTCRLALMHMDAGVPGVHHE